MITLPAGSGMDEGVKGGGKESSFPSPFDLSSFYGIPADAF
jgi:hypothetical protein